MESTFVSYYRRNKEKLFENGFKNQQMNEISDVYKKGLNNIYIEIIKKILSVHGVIMKNYRTSDNVLVINHIIYQIILNQMKYIPFDNGMNKSKKMRLVGSLAGLKVYVDNSLASDNLSVLVGHFDKSQIHHNDEQFIAFKIV